MNYKSILFLKEPGRKPLWVDACFHDFHLDKVFFQNMISSSKDKICEWYHYPLNTLEEIQYRQDISRSFKDCEFSLQMNVFHKNIGNISLKIQDVLSGHYKIMQEFQMLDVWIQYCSAVESFAHFFLNKKCKSQGLSYFQIYLSEYLTSAYYMDGKTKAADLKKKIATTGYHLYLERNRITVSKEMPGENFGIKVNDFFLKFRQEGIKKESYQWKNRGMNHIENQIIECLKELYPDLFSDLSRFFEEYKTCIDKGISTFCQEIQFYLNYFTRIEGLNQKGYLFCIPDISEEVKEIQIQDGFDIALALQKLEDTHNVITNDLFLHNQERIAIITGPNQGGKTTFARMAGQIEYIAMLGLPVPGIGVRLYKTDAIFTHFERLESNENNRGKITDDLIRIKDILNQSTHASLIILNETFSSTTLKDALWLGKKTLLSISEKDAFCIYVTFMDDLSDFNEKTVSFLGGIDPENGERTYQIIRKKADGKAYTRSIAKKHGLTYEQIIERMEQL